VAKAGLLVLFALSLVATFGCRTEVSDADVQRWEGTNTGVPSVDDER
jgi:hypothetical protein